MIFRRRATIVCTLSIFFAFFSVRSDSLGSEWAMWKSAYDEYATAEELYLNNQPAKALETFKSAFEQFKNLKRKYPKWNQKILKFRLELCGRRIEAVTKMLQAKDKPRDLERAPSGEAESSPTPPLVAEPTGESSPRSGSIASSITATVVAMEKELVEYKRRYRDLLKQANDLRLKADRGERALKQVEDLLKANTDLKEKYSRQLIENEKLREKPETDDVVEQWKKRFENEKINAEALRIEIKQLIEDNSELSETKTAAESKQAQWQLALEAEQTNIIKLEETIAGLKKRLAESGEEAASPAPKLAHLEQKNSELAAKLEDKTRELAALSDKFAALSERELDDEAMAEIRAEKERLRGELETVRGDLAALKEQRGPLASEHDDAKAKIEKLNTILGSLNANQEQLEKDLYFYKSKFAQSQTLGRNQKRRIVSLTNENKKLSEDIKELGASYEVLRGKSSSVENNLKNFAKLEDENHNLRNQNAALEEIRKKLELETGEAKRELEASRKRAAEAAATVKNLGSKLETTKRRLADAKGVDANDGEAINKLRSELKDVRGELKKKAEEEKVRSKERRELEKTITSQQSYIMELKNASPEMLVSTRILNEPEQNLDLEFKDQMDRDVIAFLLSSAEQSKRDGNIDSVIWHYKKIISICPDNIEVLRRLAEIYSARGDDNNALLYYEKAFRVSPDDADILNPLGALHAKNQNNRLAMAILNRSLDVAPNIAETHRLLGEVCANLGWRNAAENELREALRLDPLLAKAARSLSELLATEKPKRLAEGRKMYEKSKELGAKPDKNLEDLFNAKESKR